MAAVASALRMAAIIWQFLTGQVALWHIYAAMLARNTAQAFRTSAAAASAMLVPADFLPRSAGLSC